MSTSDGETKLRFTTLAYRRVLASDYDELAPLVLPALTTYGSEDRTRTELSLALSELPEESKPATVARLLFPDGVRLEQVECELKRTEQTGRLGRAQKATVTVIVVPEMRPEGDVAGHWVFVPTLDHACFVDRKGNIAKRVQEELEVLPSALALGLDQWRRLMTWVPSSVEPIEVELATTPLAQVKGRKALAEAERRRQAQVTLASAGRQVFPGSAPALVGRSDAMGELSRALDHRLRRSILLVGEESAGKSALVEAWVTENLRQSKDPNVKERPVWATSAAELVAGASGLGEWQARVAAVLDAAEILDAILYFDDFGALFADRPSEGGVDIGAAIRRHVVDGRVRVIGELTSVALDRAERQDVSLIGAMLRVQVPALDPTQTIDACRAWATYWARSQPQRPQIKPEMIPNAVDLAKRYLPYRAFPGKAVRLLEELRVAHETARDDKGEGKLLGDSELYASFSWATGIPIALLDDQKAIARDEVVKELRRRMIGQDAAVKRVAEAICVAKARLQPADKPLASLLFVGPSGVGKTELARSVAAYLFGAPDRMVRLDMSEYTDPWAAERLFGAGNDEGRLTAAVRSQPFGVVLLDEIEKAHPSVFDLLLQVLGEARLTDGRGRTTFFHNAIIVLTSNLGTRSAKGRLGISPAESERDQEERRYRDAVLGAFRPELVNRLDQIVVFHPLQPDEIAKVADIAVARLAERRGLTQAGVILDISPAAVARIAEGGFLPELGARALRRYLDTALVAPAARLLARAGGDGHGGTLTVRAPDEEVTRDKGSRIGLHEGDIHISLWRRAASTGKRMVRSALALGELRRDTDREIAMNAAQAVHHKIGEIEGTLATASRKKPRVKDPASGAEGEAKTGLPGRELARLSTEHARLSELWNAATTAQGELRTAEELCLEALARDVDAIDLIEGAVLQRHKFRSELFWLLTGLRPQRPGITLMAHSPDAKPALTAWTKLVAAAAGELGMRINVHLYGEQQPGWTHGPWGPPHDRAWAENSLASAGASTVLVRIAGPGAESLFGLEVGLHKFVGLAGEPCHVWVDAIEPRVEFQDDEWPKLPPPPSPKSPRGTPMREITISADRVAVLGEEIEPTWAELPKRLTEAAVTRLIEAYEHNGHGCRYDEFDTLWTYPQAIAKAEVKP